MEPDAIREILERALPDCTAVVTDDAGDKQHFSAEVVSSAFEGLPRVRQHRLVYQALGGLADGRIHALALKTYTPARWNARGRT
ncbi:MAG: BolA family transcriptional regulator [Alphaproteobacteria bacterium]|nr:BolA family transcriptional regulator [Alphaproteobacteria bacterium]MCB9796870.1 BolA family transcriptional regulator [Alphaproteobacteria bacterium]